MKLEKQKIFVILVFSILVGVFAFSCVYDPYAEKRAEDNFMSLILARMGLTNMFGGF